MRSWSASGGQVDAARSGRDLDFGRGVGRAATEEEASRPQKLERKSGLATTAILKTEYCHSSSFKRTCHREKIIDHTHQKITIGLQEIVPAS
jgi:hypothetical protein